MLMIMINSSFCSVEAQDDIYGHANRAKGKVSFKKGAFYSSNGSDAIINIAENSEHKEARKLLSHSFSAKALREQVVLVEEYVNKLMDQIAKKGDTEEGINLTEVSLPISSLARREIPGS